MEKTTIPKMKTIKEVSKIVGLAEYHVRQLVKQNKINFIRAGKKYLINLESLIDYLNNGEVETEAKEQNENTNKIRKVGV